MRDLEDLAAGRPTSKTIEEHLTSCDACRLALERIRDDNAFLVEVAASVRAARSDPSTRRASEHSDYLRSAPDRFESIDGYHIQRRIGRGGQAIVYEAVQESTRRRVALKLMLFGEIEGGERRSRRFEREIELVAGLKHPGIVTVYEGGRTRDGRPYFAMELVHGVRLDEWIWHRSSRAADQVPGRSRRRRIVGALTRRSGGPRRETASDLRPVVALFARICAAVAYAHQSGIIHRDLKPSNILIVDDDVSRAARQGQPDATTAAPSSQRRAAGQASQQDASPSRAPLSDSLEPRDRNGRRAGTGITSPPSTHSSSSAEPCPKILDFGLARMIEREDDMDVTMTGEFLGTLAYAAPEQVASGESRVDTRTDVHALGLILYEMLTGQPALPRTGAMSEVVRSIREASPARPSSIRSAVGDELDTIVVTALAKEPDRRYHSAGALLEDIERFLDGRPILAKRESLSYLLRKQVRRHRLPVAFACTLFLVLVGALIVTVTYWRAAVASQVDLKAALDRALHSEQETRRVVDAQARMLSTLEPRGMGQRLRDDIIHEARAAMARTGLGDDVAAQRMATLESLLSGVNFTNAGVHSIDRNVLTPALASVERDFAGHPLVQAALWMSIASAYRQLGRYASAQSPAELALATRSELLGNDHKDTLASIDNLANILFRQRKFSEAEPYFTELLDRRRRLLGHDHPDTLDAMSGLGTLLFYMGRIAEAEPHMLAAMEGRRRLAGDDDPLTLAAIGEMGLLRASQFRVDEAEQLLSESVDGLRRVLGDADPSTASRMINLGSLLRVAGRLPEAAPHLERAVETSRRALGDEHAVTLYAHRELGSLRRECGRITESERLLRDVLDACRRLLGDGDLATLNAHRELGILLLMSGQCLEAETHLRTALDRGRETRGELHESTLVAMSALGETLRELGRHEEALAIGRDALERFMQTAGEAYPETLAAMSRLASVLRELGELNDADRLGAAAVHRAEHVLPREHWARGAYLAEHARTLLAMQRHEEARTELIEACDVLGASLGPEHRYTAGARAALAQAGGTWDPSRHLEPESSTAPRSDAAAPPR